LQKLHLEKMHSISKEGWIGLANQLCSVQMLSCSDMPPFGVFYALAGGDRVRDATVGGDIFLPHLRTLEFMHSDVFHNVGPDGQTLMDVILGRQSRPGAIQKLIIKKCKNITAGTIAWLEDNVPRVNWDGEAEDVDCGKKQDMSD